MTPKSFASWQIDAAAALILLALTAGAYFAQVQPALQAREERSQRATQLTEAREKTADLETSAAQLKDKLNTVRLAAAQSITLEPVAQLNARLAKLTEFAAAKALQLDAIEPGAALAGDSGRYETVPIRLAGKGTYHDVTEFLRALHATLPDTGVALVELTAADNGAAAAFTLQLQWHTAPRSAHDASAHLAAVSQN